MTIQNKRVDFLKNPPDRLLSGLTAQQKGTSARWYSNKTSLIEIEECLYRGE